MKTLKIPEKVHHELKRFVADNPKETMETVAGVSIMQYLQSKGHKFLSENKSNLKR